MRIGALIECRSASERLPGKCFMEIEERSMIQLVYDRVSLCKSTDHVRVVIPNGDANLGMYCRQRGMKYAAGNSWEKGDVMQELARTAREHALDLIIEITGDCPCIDPEIIDKVVSYHLHRDCKGDFTGWDFVKGAEVRVFTREALERAVKLVEGYKRNGSTIFYRKPKWKSEMMVMPEWWQAGPAAGLNYSVDTQLDLERVRAIYKQLPWKASLKEIVSVAGDLHERALKNRGRPSIASAPGATSTS